MLNLKSWNYSTREKGNPGLSQVWDPHPQLSKVSRMNSQYRQRYQNEVTLIEDAIGPLIIEINDPASLASVIPVQKPNSVYIGGYPPSAPRALN